MKMKTKKDIIKKVVMSRRLLTTSKLMEETNLNLEGLQNIQKQYLQLLEFYLLRKDKICNTSERMCWTKEPTQSFWEIYCQLADESPSKNNGTHTSGSAPASSTARRSKSGKSFLKSLRADLKRTSEEALAIEVEKKNILRAYVEREAEVQKALVDFLQRQ